MPFARTAARSIPRPSSSIAISIVPLASETRTRSMPFSGLPAAARTAGASIP